MNSPKNLLSLFVLIAVLSGLLAGQQASPSAGVVPHLVNYSGRTMDAKGTVVSASPALPSRSTRSSRRRAPVDGNPERDADPRAPSLSNWALRNPKVCPSIFSLQAKPAGWACV